MSLWHRVFSGSVPESWSVFVSSQGHAYMRLPPSWQKAGYVTGDAFFVATDDANDLFVELVGVHADSPGKHPESQVLDAVQESLQHSHQGYRRLSRRRRRLRKIKDPAWSDPRVPRHLFEKVRDCDWLRCDYQDDGKRYRQETYAIRRGHGILVASFRAARGRFGRVAPLVAKAANTIRVGRIA